MKETRFLIASMALACLMACSSLGLAPATTLDAKIAYGYAGIDTALKGIATATTAGQLSSDRATQANNMALAAKAILDTARIAETSNATAATNDLNLATAALTALQQYLTANGVKQ